MRKHNPRVVVKAEKYRKLHAKEIQKNKKLKWLVSVLMEEKKELIRKLHHHDPQITKYNPEMNFSGFSPEFIRNVFGECALFAHELYR